MESNRRVTLVSAPAGFGKTTCVAEWLGALKAPAAWLSLDPAYDDPGRFFTSFVAALQTENENIGREIAGILRAGQLPPEEIIVTTLGNDILELEERVLLVLDDFQVIQDGFILRVLEKLIAGPLQPLHLVLITREDPPLPLARLRANGQLTEIRAADLRFSDEEAGRFLNEVMDLNLSPADVAALEKRTEGWIVGLHLAGLSMRGGRDPSRFIAELSGGQRHILGYLTEEVLNRQTEDIRRFLMETSVLEKLSGDLCDAVTGGADGRAMLERLLRANLFLVPLDEERRWYRYHPLFAEMLRDRLRGLPKEEFDELHRRAGLWYGRAGMVDEAIRHHLAAADYAAAVRLIEAHAMDLLMQWHVKTVDGWMQSVPQEWCARSIRANLAFAWVHMMRQAHAQSMPHLQRLYALFAESRSGEESDPSLKAKWLALQSMMLNAQGKAEESLLLGRQALETAPAGDSQARCMAHTALAGVYQQAGEDDRAADSFQQIIRHGREEGNSIYEMLGVSGLCLLAIKHGRLHFGYEVATKGIERMERAGALPPVSMAVYGELGSICYQWHRLEEAHRFFRRAIQVGTLSGFSDAKLFYGVILSRLHQMEGNLNAAVREIQEAADLMRVAAAVVVREEVIAQQVRVYLAQDRLNEAEALLVGEGFSFAGRISRVESASGGSNPQAAAVLFAAALRILLHRARTGREGEGLKSGLELADAMAAGALQGGYVPFAIEMLLLRARLHAAAGNDEPSRTDYLKALELAQPEGMISVFVEGGESVAAAFADLLARDRLEGIHPDFVKTVLAAFSGSAAPAREAGAELPEQLTDRERDVLRLISEGLRYEDVADRLCISLNTVRSHIKAIYGKLGVNNRTRAIETAHQMQIL